MYEELMKKVLGVTTLCLFQALPDAEIIKIVG
jgi:hypothetical protein